MSKWIAMQSVVQPLLFIRSYVHRCRCRTAAVIIVCASYTFSYIVCMYWNEHCYFRFSSHSQTKCQPFLFHSLNTVQHGLSSLFSHSSFSTLTKVWSIYKLFGFYAAAYTLRSRFAGKSVKGHTTTTTTTHHRHTHHQSRCHIELVRNHIDAGRWANVFEYVRKATPLSPSSTTAQTLRL